VALVSANFTGAVRLLVGLGWPMIYTVAAFFHRKKHRSALRVIRLEPEHSVEVMGMLLPLAYFVVIAAKGTLSIWDGVVLTVFYVAYMAVLQRIPPKDLEDPEQQEWPIKKIVVMKPLKRNLTISGLFIGGAVANLLHRRALPALPALAGPHSGDLPVRLRAVGGALLERVPRKALGLLLGPQDHGGAHGAHEHGLLQHQPVDHAGGHDPGRVRLLRGHVQPIPFDHEQRIEIFLTIAQSAYGLCLLINMAFAWHEAVILFALFLAQFCIPGLREEVTFLYLAFVCFEVLRWLMRYEKPLAFYEFGRLFRERVLRKR